jgi:hypothetical protein
VGDGAETIEMRVFPCCMCEQPVHYQSAKATAPESPEMIQLAPGAWVGVTAEDDGSLRFVFTCSDACRAKLLSE